MTFCNNALPLISVIVPIYNAEKWIERCVVSILKQTYTNIELILINDGSKDSSASICRQLLAHDSRIKFIEQPNSGPNAARNRGLKAAHGDIIAFADADDEFYSYTTFEVNIQLLIDNPEIDIVSIPQYLEQSNGQLKTKQIQFKRQIISGERNIFINWYNSSIIDGTFPGKFFRKKLFDGWQLIEEIRFTEDVYNIPDLCKRCQNVLISPSGGYLYKYNDKSSIHTAYDDFKRFGRLKSGIRIYEYFNKLGGCNDTKIYFNALEEAYYLLGTKYEAETISLIGKLHRIPPISKRKFHILLFVTIFFAGPVKGLKLTNKYIKPLLSRKLS